MFIDNSKSGLEHVFLLLNSALEDDEKIDDINKLHFTLPIKKSSLGGYNDPAQFVSVNDYINFSTHITRDTQVIATNYRSKDRYNIYYRRICIPLQWKILIKALNKTLDDVLPLEVSSLDKHDEIKREMKRIWDWKDSDTIFSVRGEGNTRVVELAPVDNSYLYETTQEWDRDKVVLTISVGRKDGVLVGEITPDHDNRLPIVDIVSPSKTDDNGTKSNEGDGFEYAVRS